MFLSQTPVMLDLREPQKVPPTHSESHKDEHAGTTESASTNKSRTDQEETQQEEEQEKKQRNKKKQEDRGAKQVEDSTTNNDISILRWQQGLKLTGDRGQRKGHKDLKPQVVEGEETQEPQRHHKDLRLEVVEEEETEEPQGQMKMSHTADHGGSHPPPQLGPEIVEKEVKDADLKQKERSNMEGQKKQYSPQGQRDGARGATPRR